MNKIKQLNKKNIKLIIMKNQLKKRKNMLNKTIKKMKC